MFTSRHFRLLWRAYCLLLLASMTYMFILFLPYFTWWILFSACMRGLQARDVKVSVYLQGMYKQRAWSKPYYLHSKVDSASQKNLAAFFKVPKYRYSSKSKFEHLKIFFMRKKMKISVPSLISLQMVNLFIFKENFFWQNLSIKIINQQRLYIGFGWRWVFPGRIHEAILSVIPNIVQDTSLACSPCCSVYCSEFVYFCEFKVCKITSVFHLPRKGEKTIEKRGQTNVQGGRKSKLYCTHCIQHGNKSCCVEIRLCHSLLQGVCNR